ncbi:hypothetical protein [Thermomonas sp.]|uniref:hypothetical protein n=1 Tax=Thermomonas sp. TaxID=1971895 RepID=UPI002C03446D|nr:hypothetical protein [Thermomonas sp.]HRO62369.1 hypothetical protein [Thermomonas sp.]
MRDGVDQISTLVDHVEQCIQRLRRHAPPATRRQQAMHRRRRMSSIAVIVVVPIGEHQRPLDRLQQHRRQPGRKQGKRLQASCPHRRWHTDEAVVIAHRAEARALHFQIAECFHHLPIQRLREGADAALQRVPPRHRPARQRHDRRIWQCHCDIGRRRRVGNRIVRSKLAKEIGQQIVVIEVMRRRQQRAHQPIAAEQPKPAMTLRVLAGEKALSRHPDTRLHSGRA